MKRAEVWQERHEGPLPREDVPVTRYELTITATITVDARDEEHAFEKAMPLARTLIREDGATLHIDADTMNNADIEELP